MTNPWSGRFDAAPDEAFLSFGDSTPEDAALVRDDVVGSLAHAAGLAEAGILSADEHVRLAKGLRGVLARLEEGEVRLEPSLEDVHMNVETLLGDEVGELAGKLHTGRSRNDQVALDMRLFARRQLLSLADALVRFADALLAQGARHAALPMPGFTHLQPAMPVTFGHVLHAHAERALRDAARCLDAFARTNVSPLGAAALAGTSYRLPVAATATRLGFDAPFANSLDAVSDRDFVAESTFAASLVAVHLSQLGEELVLWASPAFGFVKLPDSLTTGSSIMPQKRNPDGAELLRGRAGPALAECMSVLVSLKSLPLAYNRDLQEAKPPLVRALPRAVQSVEMARAMVAGLEPVPEKMRAALSVGYQEATELADLLAQHGLPFRKAHHVVGSLVKEAEKTGRSLAELAAGHKAFAGLDVSGFGYDAAVARKTTPGGTAPERVAEQVAQAQARAAALTKRVGAASAKVLAAESALLAA